MISSKEENETVFNVLQHTTLGLAALISQHESIDKNFKKELFELDIENVYFDKDRIKRVTPKDKFILDTTYYFQYFYKDKKNKVLVPVTIKNNNETLVVKNINKIEYSYKFGENGIPASLFDFTSLINSDFIKNKLDENIKEKFEDNLFEIKEFKIDNRNMIFNDLKSYGVKIVKVVYDYGYFKNQEINLRLEVDYSSFYASRISDIPVYDLYLKEMKVKSIDALRKEITERLK